MAKYSTPARWYNFKEETTVKLRVQEPMIKDVERAKLPAFLRAQFQKHWGNVVIRGYDSRKGHTYFLEPGTFRILSIDTVEDRIKEIQARGFLDLGRVFINGSFSENT